jgi:hypothetical protein
LSRDTTFWSVPDISVDVRRALEAQVSESPLLRTDRLARFRHPTLPGLADMQPATAGSCKLLAAARGKDV